MKKSIQLFMVLIVALSANLIFSIPVTAADPLASWNDRPAKKAILEFVAAVTDKNSKDYVKPSDRIATFDNDGTLWI
jgi:hypothetical protein